MRRSYQFKSNGTALSLDGTENWQIYTAWSDALLSDDNQNILVHRPSGEWIMFSPDGRELHFATVCDTCSDPASDPFCLDAGNGGKARLVKIVDAKGSIVQLTYNRPGGVLVGLSDDLGHSLQVRSTSACMNGLASSLVYDGMTVATYSYSGLNLMQATDVDGNVLRSYAYNATTGRLLEVKNQAGDAVVSFSYDASGRATGVIDRRSSVSVNYDAPGGVQVTEFYSSTSSTGVRTLDRDGRVTSISDGCACGPARTMQWKDQRLVCSVDALGHVVWQDFDTQGRLTHRAEYSSSQGCPTTAPTGLGAESREEWRDYGITRPIAQGVSLALDPVTAISRKGTLNGTKYVAESFNYDPTSKSIDPAGYTCQQSPLPTGSVLCRQIEGGYLRNLSGSTVFERHATFFSYDTRGRLIRTLGPINLDFPSASDVMPVEERTYWPDTESLTRRGRLKEVKRFASPTGTPLVTSYDYDAFGPYQIIQPNGAVTTMVKDGRGRPIVVVTPDGGTRQTRYHDGLDPRLQILASGGAMRMSHDAVGRLANIEYLSSDPEAPGATPTLGWGEYYTYDAGGNRIHTERRNAQGVVTWQQDRTYDVQHRLVSDTNPENPATARMNVFDTSGFLTEVTDEQGRATNYTPDGLNRVKKVTRNGVDNLGAPVSLDVAKYTYQNFVDSLSAVIDGKSQNTTYSYDDFGRLQRLGSPNFKGGTASFTYDSRGNLLQKKDSYTTVSYTYDGLDRVLTVNAGNSYTRSSVTYAYFYDVAPYRGQLTSVVESDRTVFYGYDAAGRLTSETIQENGVSTPLVTQYQHDADGAVSDIIYPSGLHVQLVRDPATREVIEVKNAADGTLYASQVDRMPGGPVKSFIFGNGLTLTQTFNRRYEPQTITSGPLSLGYGMTPAGDIQSMAQGGTTSTFQYDFLDRLTTSPSLLSYGYDNNGNRTSQMVDGAAANYTYSNDQLSSMLVPSGTSQIQQYGYGYDFQSNLTVIWPKSGSNLCLRHDALSRMTLVGTMVYGDPFYCSTDSYLKSVTARFKYDFRNRRVAAWSAATNQWTYIISDAAGNPLSEMVKTGDPQNPWMKYRDYVWLDGKPLAQIEYPGPAGSTQGYVNYFHLDHIGLPRALTNANQQTIWSATARPYGDIVENTTTDPLSGRTIVTNLRLPGQYDERLLSSLGLQGPYYNWNRWYLPGVGRYLELDPIALRGKFNAKWGPDWYGYAGGNPLRRVDPRGLSESDYQDCVWNCELAMAGCLLVGGATCYATGPFIPYCWSQVGVCCIILEQACEKNCESRRNE